MSDILEFNEIKINFKPQRIKKLYHRRTYLSTTDSLLMRQKLDEVDRNLHKLQHLKSILEKILLKDSLLT